MQPRPEGQCLVRYRLKREVLAVAVPIALPEWDEDEGRDEEED